MKSVKLTVIYPRPKDFDSFKHIYQSEHVPLAVARLAAKTKMVATRVLASPQGTPPFYRIGGGLLSIDASFGGMRCFDRRQGSACTCCKDFFGWTANFLGSRGRDFHLR